MNTQKVFKNLLRTQSLKWYFLRALVFKIMTTLFKCLVNGICTKNYKFNEDLLSKRANSHPSSDGKRARNLNSLNSLTIGTNNSASIQNSKSQRSLKSWSDDSNKVSVWKTRFWWTSSIKSWLLGSNETSLQIATPSKSSWKPGQSKKSTLVSIHKLLTTRKVPWQSSESPPKYRNPPRDHRSWSKGHPNHPATNQTRIRSQSLLAATSSGCNDKAQSSMSDILSRSKQSNNSSPMCLCRQAPDQTTRTERFLCWSGWRSDSRDTSKTRSNDNDPSRPSKRSGSTLPTSLSRCSCVNSCSKQYLWAIKQQ